MSDKLVALIREWFDNQPPHWWVAQESGAETSQEDLAAFLAAHDVVVLDREQVVSHAMTLPHDGKVCGHDAPDKTCPFWPDAIAFIDAIMGSKGSHR